MSAGEDESSPGLNGRLRPRKSTTSTSSPQTKTIRKTDGIKLQDRPKRTSTPSKASPYKQDDLSTKFDSSSIALFLCPYCDRKFTTQQTASKHARRIHLSTSKQDNFIKCIYCNHSDAESHAIIKHLVDCHPNQYFACLDCHTRFPSTTELAEHKLNVCEKQKPTYRSKLRQKSAPRTKKKSNKLDGDSNSDENMRYTDNHGFNGIVISCELKPSNIHDATDIEDKITTNLILPPSKTLRNTSLEKSAVIVLDDLQWNKRIPPNFSFHNTDTDQILSRLGVVHRSPRVGESRKDLIRLMDEPNEKFEKCFDTSFYSRVAKNVQENLAKYLDGSFNFNPDRETIKTRKSKASVAINTAEGFPILLAYEQFSRSFFDGFMPRAVAPKHKWKWDTADSDNKNAVMLLDQPKRDSHVNNCIVTLVSSLDIWTQLRMKRKFEEIFKTTPAAKKTEKQNIISMELKEILESRDIPTSSSHVVKYHSKSAPARQGYELPMYLGLSPTKTTCEVQPAVLSGEWVRPRAYVCCACGEQTRDPRSLSTHITSQHPNAQVQHYEIVGETLLSADILKHLYVPPSQMSNRTRPPRGFRDCTKCKKSITLEDLHQHMLDCAGDTPTVRRKCRYRPFGVRRRRPRLPDNTIRKKMRKDIGSRHRQKVHMRPRPRIRTEVGDAETIRKMIADLPAKRNRICSSNVLRPRRNHLNVNKAVKLRGSEDKKSNNPNLGKNFKKKSTVVKKQNDNDNASPIDEDDRPLKLSTKHASGKVPSNDKGPSTSNGTINQNKNNKQRKRKKSNMWPRPPYLYQPEPTHNFGSDIISNIDPSFFLPPHAFVRPEPFYLPNQVPNIDQNERARQNEIRNWQVRHQLSGGILLRGVPQLAVDEPYESIDVHSTNPSILAREEPEVAQLAVDQADEIIDVLSEEPSIIANQEPDVAQLAVDQPYERIDVHSAGLSILAREEPGVAQQAVDQADEIIDVLSEGPSILANQEPDVAQLAVDQPFERIDVHGAGPSNIKQHGNHDNYSSQNVKDRSNGGRDNGNQNNNITPKSNTPFRHSIASLTSDAELQDVSITYQHPNLTTEINTTIAHESPFIRQEFENEAVESTLDKPPISEAIKSVNSVEPNPPSQHNLVKHRETDGQPLPNDPIESVVPSNFIKSIEGKTEADKSKLNKSRKGINDCIAMLITKKRLRLDSVPGKPGDDDALICESADIASEDADILRPENMNSAVAVDPDQSVNANTNQTTSAIVVEESISSSMLPEVISHNNIDLTPARVFSRSSLPELTSSRIESTDDSILLHATDNVFTSPAIKKSENKIQSTRSRSTSRSEYENTSQGVGSLQIDRPPRVEPRDHYTDNALHINRRNSYDGLSTSGVTESFRTDNILPHTFNPLYNMGDRNLPEMSITSQATYMRMTEDQRNMRLFVEQLRANYDRQNANALAQQSAVSTARRTRRRPAKKNLALEQQSTFNYRRSTPPLHTPYTITHNKNSPDTHTTVSADYGRNLSAESIDSNVQLPILAGPSSIETVSLASPEIQGEQYNQITNNTETGSEISHNRDDSTRNKRYKSPENHTVHTNAEIHLAAAQSKERLIRETNRGIVNTSQSNRSASNLHMTSSEDLINDKNVRHDVSNEVQRHYSSIPTFGIANQDISGINVDVERIDTMKETRVASEKQETSMAHFENQQQIRQFHAASEERNPNRNTDTRVAFSAICSKTTESTYINPESNANIVKSTAVDLNMQPYEIQYTGDYYRRTGPYPRNSPSAHQRDVTEYSLVYDRNRRDESLRACHTSFNNSYPIPRVSYNNNIYGSIPYMSAVTFKSHMEEITPLDLSFDPRNRNEKQVFDSIVNLSDASKQSGESQTPQKNDLESAMTGKLQRKQSVQLHSSKSSEDIRNEKLVSLPHLTVTLEGNEPNAPLSRTDSMDHGLNLEQSENENIYLQNRTSDSAANPVSTFKKITTLNSKDHKDIQHPLLSGAENALYNLNSHTISGEENFFNAEDMAHSSRKSADQCISQPFDCNYLTPRQVHSTNETINLQERCQLTHAGISQVSHIVSEPNLENNNSSTTKNVMNPVNANSKSSHRLETVLNSGSTPSEIFSKNTNDTPTPESLKIVDNINSSDALHQQNNVLIDKDQETAQKIAMIPKEIIDIINRIPEDTRNKLINVLPQYVTTPIPISITRNDVTNNSPAAKEDKNNVLAHQENKQHSISLDPTRLSVNTAISPSSIIPKKRHSPSQTKGALNYNESQFTASFTRNMHEVNLLSRNKNLQNECQENIVGICVMRRKSMDKDNDDTDINVVDLSDPESINKSIEVPKPTGNDFIPPIAAQELLSRSTKPKNFNEQTASLRAVRIKPSSARKSFSDEKQMASYYQTNVSPNETEYANSGQTSSLKMNKSLTDAKYDDINIDNNDIMHLCGSKHSTKTIDKIIQDKSINIGFTSQNNTISDVNVNLMTERTAHFIANVNNSEKQALQVSSEKNTVNLELIPDKTDEMKNINIDFKPKFKSFVAQNSIKKTRETPGQFVNTIILDSEVVLLESTKDESDRLLHNYTYNSPLVYDSKNISQEHLPEAPIIDHEKQKQLLITKPGQPHNVKNDFITTELKSLTKIDTENENVFSRSAKHDESNQIFLPTLLASPNNSFTENTDTLTETLLITSQNEEKNGDDSEDDICLALIKQKHSELCGTKTYSSAPGTTTELNAITTDVNTRDKKYQRKGQRKCRRKKLSKNFQISDKNKFSGCLNAGISVTLYDKELDNQSDIISKTAAINSDQATTHYEFDVNKENNISENINTIKEIESIISSEHIQNEIQPDTSVDKNISSESKDNQNINLDLDTNNQQLEEKVNSTSENMTAVAGQQSIPLDTDEAEIIGLSKTCDSKAEQNGKIQKSLKFIHDGNVSTKPDNKTVKFDAATNKDYIQTASKKIDSVISSSLLDNSVLNLPEIDTKYSTETTQSYNFESDFKLCSEILDATTLPLRRSRRGKSMYVDSSSKDDSEHTGQVENIDHKAPLTMKRLILSRVEKDKKRINDSIILEKSNHNSKSVQSINEEIEVLDIPRIHDLKGKQAKRKRSPQLTIKCKKTKPTSTDLYDGQGSAVHGIQIASDNGIEKILRHAENEIDTNETIKDLNNVSSDYTTHLPKIVTLPDIGSTDDQEKDGLTHSDSEGTKDTTVSGKRKSTYTKVTELPPSKSKKTKYYKKKDSSDFDSDDERGLIETKQKNEHEKLLQSDNSITATSTNKSVNEEIAHDKSPECCDGGKSDILKLTPNTITLETRMTCYSRPISNRKLRSSTASLKDHINYDPYDIDFEDMVEPLEPILKKRGKTIVSGETTKFRQAVRQDIKNDEFTLSDFSSLSSKHDNLKHEVNCNVNVESDSDSSKSDVPLLKYVKDKINKNGQKNIDDSEVKEETTVKYINVSSIVSVEDSVNRVQNEENTDDVCSNVEPACDEKDAIVQENYDESLCDRDIDNIIINNNVSVDQSIHKQQNKQKKPRRTLAVCNNVESICVSNELEQQLKSDKFMENFGFYSERIPRKSNLLASKKISETFHMIGNESDDSYITYKEKSSKKSNQNENKKKSEAANDFSTSQDSRTMTSDATNSNVQSTVPKMDVVETHSTNNAAPTDDSDVDSITAQTILESEEVRNLENDLISGLKEAADANVARNNMFSYQYTRTSEKNATDSRPDISILNTKEVAQSRDEGTKSVKKPNKNKTNKEIIYKEKMYPDVEEIDMFEDKFDKIKRKRRSQAVAAKQVQNTVETSTSAKSRKQADKKKSVKNSKKNSHQNTQILTKGALKGFDGIKISIPTQDLNMPPNVSPPRHQKKRKKVTSKRRKESCDTETSCSESEEKEKSILERDIYEFKDSEDTELLELRPSTVMDRFRSMNKNKLKSKEKEKAKCDAEKPRERVKEKEKKIESKDKEWSNNEKYQEHENGKRHKKLSFRVEKRIGKDKRKDLYYAQEKHDFKGKCVKRQENINVLSTKESVIQYKVDDKSAPTEITHDHNDKHNKDDHDNAIASTSGFVPDRMDESDYESELSSPEGEFIFYMSDDINCVCPSDNDSDDSDVERGCGRPNCIYKSRNADKNTAIGNIFKNNAVRCEKPETKEPEEPRPDMDQLFDSLLETKPTSNETKEERSMTQNIVTPQQNERLLSSDSSTKIDKDENVRHFSVSQHDHKTFRPEGNNMTSKVDLVDGSIYPKTQQDQIYISKSLIKTKKIEKCSDIIGTKISNESVSRNVNLSDISSTQSSTIVGKTNDKTQLRLGNEDASRIHREVVNETVSKDPKIKHSCNKDKTQKAINNQPTECKIENNFSSDKQEPLNQQDKLSKSSAEKTSDFDEGEVNRNYNYDIESDNESTATKYLRELSPAAATPLEIYTTVSAQGTQTVKSKRHNTSKHDDFSQSKINEEMDILTVPKTRIRLQKYENVRDGTHKLKSTKSIQTDINKSSKYSKHDNAHTESDDDDPVINKSYDRHRKERSSAEVFNEPDVITPVQEADSFAAPTSRAADKHSPRKSDEGISTSHDCSADAFDQALYDNTGVARQRARRKCTVGKQNILAEHWSSESEFDGIPPRPNSADSVVASASRKKKSKKKDGLHSGGRRGSRHASKHESKVYVKGLGAGDGVLSEESDVYAYSCEGGTSRPPPGPKMRARPAHHYWSSDGEETSGPQPQHGWIVGDSHKKLVTMLAHAKGRKRTTADKRHNFD